MQVVIAGLDPAIHPSSQKALTKKMDARGVSAFTRVFNALLPAHDNLCYAWQKSNAWLAPGSYEGNNDEKIASAKRHSRGRRSRHHNSSSRARGRARARRRSHIHRLRHGA